MLIQSVYNQKGKVMFQSLELLPWKQSLKNKGFKNNLVLSVGLLTLKVNICYDIMPVRKEEGKSYWKIPFCDDDAAREK